MATPAVRLLALLWLLSLPAASLESKACAGCHAEIYKRFAATPMARTSGAVSASVVGGAGKVISGSALYRIEQDADSLAFNFRQGEISGRRPLDWYIGSGIIGRSFATSIEGFLFQSPVSYYAMPGRWALSPGYEQDGDLNLTREIEPSCLKCHATGVQTLPGTTNGFQSPPFAEAGVGCERCHGPGEEHVTRMRAHPAKAVGIVNPAKLEGARRDSICAQCHLPGVVTVARVANVRSFQPGDRLSDSTAVFVLEGVNHETTVNGHFEQLARSACLRGSNGKLWCGTCHEVHSTLSSAAAKSTFYRERCRVCHSATTGLSCTAPRGERAKAQDNCVSCHMPSRPAETVQHAALTDHTISRRPSGAPPGTLSADLALAPFPGFVASERDLGVAYATLALRNNRRAWGLRAFELLRHAVADSPDDTKAATQLAQLYDRMGREAEACLLYTRVSATPSVTPAALVNYGTCLAKENDLEGAARWWRTALSRSPALESARLNLAVAQFRGGEAAAARATLQAGLAINPASRSLRDMLEKIGLP